MNQQQQNASHGKYYYRLMVRALLSFAAMYVLMYSMVDRSDNVLLNINQFYMAALMAISVVIIEIAVMNSMYINKKLRSLLLTVSVILWVTIFLFIRQQRGVSDRQFLRSMIPHNASAILMCERANSTDIQIIGLCERIRSNQQEEIYQMKAILKRIEDK